MLIYVENGRGDLYEAFTEGTKPSRYSLLFQGKTLFELQGDDYFCPTCEKIVKTAYNMEQTEEFHVNKINNSGTTFEEAFNEMKPLLGLLATGYYCLWDTVLYPTDGNGNLFWDYPNNDKELPGSCILYFGDNEWGTHTPHYMIATQPKKKLNMERVEYYKRNTDCRAIAFYMDGNLTALIDGHHKAMAAAMEHRECNAIVISRAFMGRRVNEKGIHQDYLFTCDASFDLEKAGNGIKSDESWKTVRKTTGQRNEIETGCSSDNFPCEINTKGLADYYPLVKQRVAMDILGSGSDEVIETLLGGKRFFEYRELELLLNAVVGFRQEKLFAVIDYLLNNYSDIDTMLLALEYAFRLPKTDELEQYLIDYAVDVEGDHPEVGKYIMHNLW